MPSLCQGAESGEPPGVARHEPERVHRHVQQVAARVLDDQEFGGIAGDLHDLQAAVAADAVLLVHHRGAGRERGQFAQDRLRVALHAPPPALLAGALPKSWSSATSASERVGRSRPRTSEATARPSARPLSRHDGQSAATVTRHALAAQHVEENLAPTGRVRRHEDASVESGDEALELVERALAACRPAVAGGGPDAKFSNAVAAPIGSTLTGVSWIRGCPREAAPSTSLGRTEGFRRRQQRALAVVAAILVARLDSDQPARERASRSTRSHDHAAAGR